VPYFPPAAYSHQLPPQKPSMHLSFPSHVAVNPPPPPNLLLLYLVTQILYFVTRTNSEAPHCAISPASF
jgi:hypothetical protein